MKDGEAEVGERVSESPMLQRHSEEVASGRRFEFGRNWDRFLSVVDEGRIVQAEVALKGLIGSATDEPRCFLDVGSGSGIVSLAARRLGLTVTSFDYDPQSVACTNELRRRFRREDRDWRVLEGSVLDESFVSSLGSFDVVYAWGVLHHTGAMWKAIDLAARAVSEGGLFVLAIYNDQGPWSRIWTRLKRIYNVLPAWLRIPYALLVMLPREALIAFIPVIKLKPAAYFSLWTSSGAGSARGMSRWYDLFDWIGGYPFEVAKPEEVFEFCKSRRLTLEKLTTCAGDLGCNEFVFRRSGTR